jgi:hypothetical protein
MPYWFVRSIEPLCPSKKICLTAQDAIDRIFEIQERSQAFRDRLWEEELIENEIPRHVTPFEMDKFILITHVNDRAWKKKFRIFKNSDFKDPFERKKRYLLAEDARSKNVQAL